MKELSIEERAKRYDEALVWMRDLYPTMEGATKEDAEHYFPELKESEDEKIRKEIKDFFSRIMLGQENFLREDYDWNAWLAWLEKQKPIKDQQKEIDYAYRRGLADCHKAYNTEPSETDFIRKEIYDIIAALPLSDKRTGMLLWLESQKLNTVTNKQKPIELSDGENIRKDLLNHLYAGANNKTIIAEADDYKKWANWLEKQGKTDEIIERAKTEKQRVILTESNGNSHIDWDTRSLYDAKTMLEHGLNYINKLVEEEQIKKAEETHNGGCPCYVPTRWDAEKKELKKIEQKSTNWSEEDERMYRELHNLIYSTPYCDSRKELSDWLKSLKDRMKLE